MYSKKSARFIATDILLLVLAVLPAAAGIVLKVVTSPPSDGIDITGARVFFAVHAPIQDLVITESQINSWLVILSLFWLCLYLTHGIAVRPDTRRQHFAELIVEKAESLVNENMGGFFSSFGPFIAAVMALSAFSSLLTLIGLFPPTSDINVVAGWSILVFILITHYKMKCGPLHYLKSFAEPVPFLTPINVISEVATPVSMSFRHYGNVLSGSVISVLLAAALQWLSHLIIGRLPGALGDFPLFRIGLPAILSVYFDIFSGCLQAFVFAMLTMLYVSGGFPADEYEKRRAAKAEKKRNALK